MSKNTVSNVIIHKYVKCVLRIKTEEDYTNSNNNLNNGHFSQNGNDNSQVSLRRRTLRSNRSESQSNGNVTPPDGNGSSNAKPGSR